MVVLLRFATCIAFQLPWNARAAVLLGYSNHKTLKPNIHIHIYIYIYMYLSVHVQLYFSLNHFSLCLQMWNFKCLCICTFVYPFQKPTS